MVLFHREKDIFQQTSLAEIYLVSVKNIRNRIALTKFRLSNHTLMIETGRHENIQQAIRLCPFCPDNIEN